MLRDGALFRCADRAQRHRRAAEHRAIRAVHILVSAIYRVFFDGGERCGLCALHDLTLTLSTARFQFPALGDRVRLPDFQASALFYSPYMKYFYFAWVSGWLLGLWTLRGRARVLVVAGIASCAALLTEILVYLLLQNAPWSFPLPVYAEQSLFPLFLVSAVAGYWGALRAAALWARALVVKMRRGSELSWRWPAKAK